MSKSFDDLNNQFQDQWNLILSSDLSGKRVLIVEFARELLQWETQQSSTFDVMQEQERDSSWNHISTLAEKEGSVIVEKLADQKSKKFLMVSDNQKKLSRVKNEIESMNDELKMLSDELAVSLNDPNALDAKKKDLLSQLSKLSDVQKMQTDLNVQIEEFANKMEKTSLNRMLELYKKLHKEKENDILIDKKISIMFGNDAKQLVNDDFSKLNTKFSQLSDEISRIELKLNNIADKYQSSDDIFRGRL